MSQKSMFELVALRHRVTRQDYLNSLLMGPARMWEVVTSKTDGDSKLEIEERVTGSGPHPIISAAISGLQTRYDEQCQQASGKAAEETCFAIRHLSGIVHIGGHRILSCWADEMLARKIALEIENSCERVRTRLSLASELSRVGQAIQNLGCGRVLRAA